MLHSIRAKFTLWYVASFIFMLLLASAVSDLIFQTFSLKSIDAGLSRGAAQIERAIADGCLPHDAFAPAQPLADCFDAALRAEFIFDILYAQLTALPENGGRTVILARSYTMQQREFSLPPQWERAAQERRPIFETLREPHFFPEIRRMTAPMTDLAGRTYLLQIGIRTGEDEPSAVRHFLAQRPHIFVVVFPFMLMVVSVAGFLFMRRAFAPIHRLVTLTKTITAEHLAQRIESVSSNDEIGELADTFNDMIARLERSFKQIQQFSGDAAHELKTPLTAMKGEIEIALRKERTPQEYREMLSSLQEDVAQLQGIIENLLFLSKMDAKSLAPTWTTVALDDVLLEAHDALLCLARQHQVVVRLVAVESAAVAGDAGLLNRLITNLLHNAIRYTPAGGSVDLFVRQSGGEAVLTVSDTGVGIPADALPCIFDRFYRVDASRSHDTGGSGLGLAIVQKIVEAHHARIEVSSVVGQGTTFRVIFKQADVS